MRLTSEQFEYSHLQNSYYQDKLASLITGLIG